MPTKPGYLTLNQIYRRTQLLSFAKKELRDNAARDALEIRTALLKQGITDERDIRFYYFFLDAYRNPITRPNDNPDPRLMGELTRLLTKILIPRINTEKERRGLPKKWLQANYRDLQARSSLLRKLDIIKKAPIEDYALILESLHGGQIKLDRRKMARKQVYAPTLIAYGEAKTSPPLAVMPKYAATLTGETLNRAMIKLYSPGKPIKTIHEMSAESILWTLEKLEILLFGSSEHLTTQISIVEDECFNPGVSDEALLIKYSGILKYYHAIDLSTPSLPSIQADLARQDRLDAFLRTKVATPLLRDQKFRSTLVFEIGRYTAVLRSLQTLGIEDSPYILTYSQQEAKAAREAIMKLLESLTTGGTSHGSRRKQR